MSEKQTLRNVRFIESFVPESIRNRMVDETCRSVADAFLGCIEYGKTYAVATELITETWNDGFGVKCTYNLDFEEIVRCRDCKHFTPKGTHKFENGKVNADYCTYVRGWMLQITPDGFCAWAERRQP